VEPSAPLVLSRVACTTLFVAAVVVSVPVSSFRCAKVNPWDKLELYHALPVELPCTRSSPDNIITLPGHSCIGGLSGNNAISGESWTWRHGHSQWCCARILVQSSELQFQIGNQEIKISASFKAASGPGVLLVALKRLLSELMQSGPCDGTREGEATFYGC